MTIDFDQVVDRRGSDSEKWHHYGEGVLPLWVADMDFVSPEPVIRAMRERVEHGVFGYGSEPIQLREVLVERLWRLYAWRVEPDDIIFLPGVIAGFNLACRAVASPGDGVLVQTPVYPPILAAPANAGLERHEMELTREPSGRYAVDLTAFEQAITARTRLFILCNPHNPVGRVFQRDELQRMAEICLSHDMVVCSDEIHNDLVFRGSRHVPVASMDAEIADRTITLMAPSKTFNIAGLGCSFAVIQNAELRRRFKRARAGLVCEVNLMGLVAALAAYRDGQAWLDQLLSYLDGNLDYLEEHVGRQLPGVTWRRPEATTLAWLDFRKATIPGNVHEFFLRQAKVALNDGASFGPGGEGFVRLNFGCPRSILGEALDRMQLALRAL
jgi:cystathionine beta-lyase